MSLCLPTLHLLKFSLGLGGGIGSPAASPPPSPLGASMSSFFPLVRQIPARKICLCLVDINNKKFVHCHAISFLWMRLLCSAKLCIFLDKLISVTFILRTQSKCIIYILTFMIRAFCLSYKRCCCYSPASNM